MEITVILSPLVIGPVSLPQKGKSLPLFELEKMKSQRFRKTELFIHSHLLAQILTQVCPALRPLLFV